MNSTHGHISPATPRILVAAGSDPTAGAGLQADLKVITALGGHALTAVTAVTVQDTARVLSVYPMPAELVAAQMRAVLADVGADAIKLGMLADAAIVAAVVGVLNEHPRLPVVADPVLRGSGGGTLLDGPGAACLLESLLPRVNLLTPNLPEAAALTGLPPLDSPQLRAEAARRLLRRGVGAVLITGGHGTGEMIEDWLFTGEEQHCFRTPRLDLGPGVHGSGCQLASAAAWALACGHSLPQAVAMALCVTRERLLRASPLGGGQRLL
ncbi:MAG: bifunctional hydroxymethylpyrimidine kinase/phosphomethylpyrimidine kinase [Magnetococcus sp. WYHC-3]